MNQKSGTKNLFIVKELVQTFMTGVDASNEIKKNSHRFLSQIDHSQQQVYGTVTIEIPEDPPGTTDESALNNLELMGRYEAAMDKWTTTIKETIAKEKNREDSRTAIAEIELWRTRAASYSTLFQQLSLPAIYAIKNRLQKNHMDPSTSLAEFNKEFKELSKLNSEAKDNVKFLTTLERQFKDLASDDGLYVVEETIPSLMNGLRMVWTISRHYKEGDKMNNLISLITNEICDKVELQINIPKLFDLGEDAEKQLIDACNLMKQGSNILNQWKSEYEKTKNSFEEEQSQVEHWEFTPKPMTERLTHMLSTIRSFMKITDAVHRFLVFLGPKLKSVTGNSEGIDILIDEVKQMVLPFKNARDNFFEKSKSATCNALIEAFGENQKVIESKTIKLIDDTFKDLRSSEGAFDLLNNFKNIETLEEISKKLQLKYSDVINTYKRELESNKKLFDKGKLEYSAGRETLIISRGNPPIAGVISWAKGIMQRIKSPMIKFNKNCELFDKVFYENVKVEYLRIIKEIDQYQEGKFKEWEEKNILRVTDYLKAKILEKAGPQSYRVNFSDDFRVLIKETKHLEKMNHRISKTIINIAFQEKEYYRYVDRLKIMLKEYEESVHTLSPIEKKLLGGPIGDLDNALQKGHDSKNLSSLGINDFILDCKTAINIFKDMKKKVAKNAGMIEDIIHSIEKAVILKEFDFEARKNNPFNPAEFCAYFEDHMQRVVAEMSEKYKFIGDQFLKAIEEGVLKTSTRCSETMREYYYYWERRVYNAIFKMVLRGLLSFKALLTKPSLANKPFTLFTIQAEYEHPQFNLKPGLPELHNMLTAFYNKIIATSKSFWRWMDGYCEFCKPSKGPNDEQIQRHTFHPDIENNKVISKLIFDTNAIIMNASHKARDFDKMFKSDNQKNLWTQKEKMLVEKLKDKNPPVSLQFLEKKMNYYKQEIELLNEMPTEKISFFYTVQFNSVIDIFKNEAKDWLNRYGNVLRELGLRELDGINREVQEFRVKLEENPKGIDDLKAMLNTIAIIKNETMMMEFRIAEVDEKFRTLDMFKQVVDPARRKEAFSLEANWNALLDQAVDKDNQLIKIKLEFSEETKLEVVEFKKGLKLLYEQYKESGPGSPNTSLDDGLQLIEYYKEKAAQLNKKKEGLVLAEKLFNLDISTFPELVTIEEESKNLQSLYDVYADIKATLKEFEQIMWVKLDAEQLKQAGDKFQKQRKKLALKYAKNTVFEKLEVRIKSFRESIPLIQQLKNGAITERHWEKLMKETGKSFESSIKTITVQEVFALNLQNFPEKVNEICTEASQEHKNEEQLLEIEQCWKKENFELKQYSGVWVLDNIADKKQILEDKLADLQTVASSRYVAAFTSKIRMWEQSLNRISETIDAWLVVQKRWQHLVGIFSKNEDIRQQLREESKKFDKNNLAFKKIMENTYRSPNILSCCVHNEGRLMELKTLADELEKRQKSLSDYLNSKRNMFPRFYFLSDEDLLSILGSSDPETCQPHMMKLFDNCKELLMSKSKIITGMESEEGERYSLLNVQKPEGPVETWMTHIEEEMILTLHRITKENVFNYASKERVVWVLENLGMVAIVGTQIWWTWRVEDVFGKVKGGNKYAMKQESAKQTKDLNDLIDIIRTDLDSLNRKKINSLIIVDVHARDIVDRFVRDSILDAKEFEWESQLRFYWQKDLDDIKINQCTGSFEYGYEYEGLNGRLVITPLTDRCVMTLTTALTFKLGGAPAGPAGTGKTETVKDLAKSLAIRCVVTNCGEGLDYKAMGIIFSGLVQTGFWGCFDEFNRITAEVLSVVSVQVKTIQNALAQEKKTLELLKRELTIKPTVGIFVTMNPGYAGRTELPDNLKSLFRPVTMVVPDSNIICEIMLMSEGFNQARLLAKKMTVLYKLASEQLSKQYHYDFGLRALKSVLVMAGSLKREAQEVAEELTLMRALRDMNMPKFVYEDVPLFKGLIKDLFPSMEIDRKPYQKKSRIEETCDNLKLIRIDNQIDKVVQLYETMITRHTTMVVGPTGSGKTSTIEILKRVENTTIYCMNPKSITVSELYGQMNLLTREWKDGLLSKTFRIANEKPMNAQPGKDIDPRWILFDGDVDAVWVQNMNSVMDDNKLLTLINGDRIRLERYCKLLFEVSDLQYASPATISRCGMVYVDPKNLSFYPFWARWLTKWEKNKERDSMYQSLKELYNKYIPPIINRVIEGMDGDEITKPFEFTLTRTNLNLVTQLTRLIDSMINPDDSPIDPDALEFLLIFAIIWSIGACVIPEHRKPFEEFLRKTSGRHLPPQLFDFYYDYASPQKNWLNWDKMVKEYVPPADGRFSSILVPTVDTQRYSYLLNLAIQQRQPCMFVGESGTAKSVIINNALNNMPADQFMRLIISFSSRTNSMDLQLTIEDNIEKRSGRIYGPKISGKKLIIFIDDTHMPKVDLYGTQQPIALLKFLIEKGYLYERGGQLEHKYIKDTQFIAAMLPPSVATSIDPRFLSLFSTYNLQFPSFGNLQHIYNTILRSHLVNFPQEIIDATEKITDSTLRLYKLVVEQLPRTPVKFHYIFNLRDLSRIYEGLTRSTIDKFSTKESMVRLWRNECCRVFGDRLIFEEDRKLVEGRAIPEIINSTFSEAAEYALADPLLFGDYMTANPAQPDVVDPRLYEDCRDYDNIRKKFEKMILDYNDDDKNKEMNLVLFNDALFHITKIYRIIRFPRGHALLVGYGGSGKQSLSKLSTFVASCKLFTIALSRGYKEREFREDLKKMFEMLTMGQVVFLFTDAHVIEEGFLQLINNLLNNGMVPALFDEDGKKAMSDRIKDEAKKKGVMQTKENLWNFFLDRCRDNLHIVLAMSPAGDTLRIRCRNFPGLISNTSIDWFQPWPEDALVSVAENLLKEQELPEELRGSIVTHMCMVHMSVQDYSKEFELQLKRKNFSTPKNYLDFINNYIKLLTFNRKDNEKKAKRYGDGLDKLEQAEKQVVSLKEDIAVKNQEANAEKNTVEEILHKIREKSIIVEEKERSAKEKKEKLDIESANIARESEEADRILEEAKPELVAAEEALNVVELKQLQELKAFTSPAPSLRTLSSCILALKPTGKENESQGFDGFKKTLQNPGAFLQSLKKFGSKLSAVPQRVINSISERLKNPDNDMDRMKTISVAGYNIKLWLDSTLKLYEVYKKVTPLKKRVEEMRRESAKMQAELNETTILLEALEKEMAEMRENQRVKEQRLAEINKEIAVMSRRLNAAESLLKGLAREQSRWKEDKANLETLTTELLGNCLTCSAFLSYIGPFDFKFRIKMVYEHWQKDVAERNIPFTQGFIIERLLTSDVQISQWASEELPSDQLSVQNGILTTRASRWPLCIDPQLQAITWIKRKYENNLKVMNMNEGAVAFLKPLENCIRAGKPFLFQNIDEELDPTIDPLLQKNYTNRSGLTFIKLGDNEFDVSDDFKLYLTTKLANPKYTPEIMGKTMVINYTVTLTGLRDQLLNVVVGYERPDKEKLRKELVHTMSENRRKLKEAEDQLLEALNTATGSLLDNNQLIEKLKTTKEVSIQIFNNIEKGENTQKEIELARQAYSPAAKRGAILFFVMSALSSISEMYEYSLNSYLGVFNNSLANSNKEKIAEARLRAIIDKLTMNVYEYTCLGIFEQHKLMFSFQMTIMILDEEKELNHAELNFFLKGNTSLEQVSQPKPYKWVPDLGWKDLQKLVTVGEEYKDIINDMERNEDDWKKWYDSEAPENEELHEPYTKLSSFQMLMLLRIFRPDRVINGIKQFIIKANNKNDKYVQPPTINFSKIFSQSSEKSPIVFILSPGADPLQDVQRLAEEKGFSGTKFKFLSLGQGMEQEASLFVDTASQRGHWLMLQNCHLLASWLKNSLEKSLELMIKPHKDFRLWLTTQPTDRFPLGILQKSLKVVTEPPDGLRLNMKSILSKLSDEQLGECSHYAFKPLVYVISFFHAIIQDRRKYGKIGWNVTYDFNQSDFSISFKLLSMYLGKEVGKDPGKEDAIPWASLKYLIGEAMYGGRVTDSYDRRVLVTYLEQYMGDFLFEKNREFLFSATPEFNYTLPKILNLEGYLNHVNEIPLINSPTVFGLHPNAEITYFTNAAKALWDNLLQMQATSAAAAGSNRQEYIESVADDVYNKLPETLWDVLTFRKEAGDQISPTKVVLFQQLQRFNRLITKIKDTLVNLKRALKGEIGMSSQLDELAISLFNGFLPNPWRRLAPQTQKKLGSWMQHFGGRVNQYNAWIKVEPSVIWLSGLHIPESYLTALVQTSCRVKGWALDKSTLYTVVENNRTIEDKKKLEHGCYVRGLYLEGAEWDLKEGVLRRQGPKELIYEMPIIQVIPVEANKLKLKDSLKTPVYVTQNRRNAMGTGLVFEADLKSKEHPSHWILQGVALAMNIDF